MITLAPAATELRNVNETIQVDIFRYVFALISPDRHIYLIQHPFGETVAHQFPSAGFDIKEAVNCMAIEANTAAVFHLMRVGEFGLRALAYDRRISMPKGPIELATWDDIIKELEKVEQAIQQYPKTLARERQFEFYHGAMMEFKRFKNKFRNRVMHTREEYDRDQAHSGFVHVRDFMQILASKISEKKRTPLIWKRP